jgi:glycine dehydrogenase subunit 1
LKRNPYVQNTEQQTHEMLSTVGVASIEELFREQVPAELLQGATFQLPPPLHEMDLLREVRSIASQNTTLRQALSFLGGGIYEHFIPAALEPIVNRSEFVTSYTPYQPEASQGTLQVFFEYQTLMARLFQMDVSNASLYDGASALGEAVLLAIGVKPDRREIVIPETLHPHYRELVTTYLRWFDVEVRVVPMDHGRTSLAAVDAMCSERTAAVVVQQPNYLGCLEEVFEISRIAKGSGAMLIAVADPISLGLLAPPGAYDADVAVGEGQPLGMRPAFGGETLGIFTCRNEYVRRMPGRLVGLTTDRQGRRGYVLTLQTREQHIRREKATSNICTNHAHNALRATVYLALLGPQGLRWVARRCARNLNYFRTLLRNVSPSAEAFPDVPCFKEVVVRTKIPAREVVKQLASRNIFAGVALDHLGEHFQYDLLIAVTELRTDPEIERFVAALQEFV